MARYKDYNRDQLKMILVAFDRQILPGVIPPIFSGRRKWS